MLVGELLMPKRKKERKDDEMEELVYWEAVELLVDSRDW